MGQGAEDADAWAEAREGYNELRALMKGAGKPSKAPSRASTMKTQYDANRAAKIGSKLSCPVCRASFLKTTYHKVFCSNQKTQRGSSSCKDQYWNVATPERKERTARVLDGEL